MSHFQEHDTGQEVAVLEGGKHYLPLYFISLLVSRVSLRFFFFFFLLLYDSVADNLELWMAFLFLDHVVEYFVVCLLYDFLLHH